MTDLQIAKNNLAGHTICLCKDGQCLFSEKRGVAPMMEFIAKGVDLRGYAVADKVVGKAAAMLFVKCGVQAVFAQTLSESGKRFLCEHGVTCEYETLIDRIINRAGTDMCPMERAVLTCENVEEGYVLIGNQLKRLG